MIILHKIWEALAFVWAALSKEPDNNELNTELPPEESEQESQDTEESHFQQSTVDPLVLDLEHCLMIKDIINYINNLGCIVNADPTLKISFIF